MNMNETICYCLNISKKDIKEAIENGATSLSEVQERTGAGTICGTCLDQLEAVVEEFVKAR